MFTIMKRSTSSQTTQKLEWPNQEQFKYPMDLF